MANQEYAVVQAQLDDVAGIHSLLLKYSDIDVLLPRSESDIYNSLRDFYVVRHDRRVIACAALLIYTRELGEVRSLAVDPEYMNMGLGNKIVVRIVRIPNHVPAKSFFMIH